MTKVYRNKAVMLFAFTLLITSLLVNLNVPMSAGESSEPIYLHGPSLTPIHMHGPPLAPVHMHAPEIIDLTNPWAYPWHEIYPDFCQPWTFTSWEDNGNGFLDSSDQIDMTNDNTAETRWYHVDRVTMTMGVWSDDYQEFLYVEFKGPYTPEIQPIDTLWHEVHPVYHGVTGGPYRIIDWIDNGSGFLDFCDYVMFADWLGIWWHVDEYATDLILNEKIMDPIDIMWHELYPSYCNWHVLTSWEEPIEDQYPGKLSPGDQIDMYNETSGITKWYFVDRVTLTLNVTIIGYPEQFYFFEYKGPFETMYDVKTNPVCTYWHMVWPDYDLSGWAFHITDWIDNCNGVLDYCDEILLEGEWCHVEGLAIDIILNEKIEDPTCTYWHELYPECCVNDYHIVGWEDNGDLLLSPCDNVTMALLPTGLTEEYHVEEVTLTLNLTVEDVIGQPFLPGDRIYVEFLGGYEWMYYAKIDPLFTDWIVVCPTDYFNMPLTIEDWYDNCNGVLSFCDTIVLLGVEQTLWCHVDEVAVDIAVEKIEPAEPELWFKKRPYPDYAPSGMPDFDQKQDAWYPMFPAPQPGHWTWCGPVAVANSLWWFDSKYDPSNIVPAFPGVPDDHHVKNVAPLVANLSWWMDTDGQRTGTVHTGTFWMDMVWGIDQYLRQQGVNDTFEVHSMEFPHFGWIEEEIYICQDVVLLLEFWYENPTGGWERIVWPYDLPGGAGGHYVTCAGVNSTTFELLISDPWWDAAEAGFPGDIPVPHAPHAGIDTTVHNDTQYVSHDAYLVAQWDPPPSPYPGSGVWELVGYLQQWAGFPPTYHTFITVAVATSPMGVNDVAVINVTTSKDGCNPMPNVGQGEDVEVNATVENQGDFDETFNVTAYADTDVIGEQQVTLNPGENKTLTFTWDTTGFPYGNYTISAVADTVSGETQTGDNTDTADEDIKVGIAGDVNADGTVNILDAIRLAGAFGAKSGDAKWNPNADINGDGVVNILDAIKLAGNFGKSEP